MTSTRCEAAFSPQKRDVLSGFHTRLLLAFLAGLVALAFAACAAKTSTGATTTQLPQASAPSSATTAPPAPFHHRASHRTGRRIRVSVRRSPSGVWSGGSPRAWGQQPATAGSRRFGPVRRCARRVAERDLISRSTRCLGSVLSLRTHAFSTRAARSGRVLTQPSAGLRWRH